MAEHLVVVDGEREQQYQALLPQVLSLIESETDIIAAMANCTAALQQTFHWLWTGFYLVKGEQLVLGPFQGPIACTRIPRGRGVCGSAWQQNQTLIVPDVDAFPGHIACSSAARSEIVLPVHDSQGQVVAVLDIDADTLAQFSELDQRYLAPVCAAIGRLFPVPANG